MSATASGTFSSFPTLLTYRLVAYETATDPATNTSTVQVYAYIDFTGGSASSSGGSGNVVIDGTSYPWTLGSQSFSGPGSIEIGNYTKSGVAHNPDGTGSAAFSGTASMTGWGSASASGTLTLTTLNVAAGKRWNGSAWSDVTVNKRWNGSAWIDLTIKKRWSGSAWVDLG